MKNSKLLALFCIVYTFYISASYASEHHSGHGATNNGGGSSGSANSCANLTWANFYHHTLQQSHLDQNFLFWFSI